VIWPATRSVTRHTTSTPTHSLFIMVRDIAVGALSREAFQLSTAAAFYNR
jgi:hypothetical protein